MWVTCHFHPQKTSKTQSPGLLLTARRCQSRVLSTWGSQRVKAWPRPRPLAQAQLGCWGDPESTELTSLGVYDQLLHLSGPGRALRSRRGTEGPVGLRHSLLSHPVPLGPFSLLWLSPPLWSSLSTSHRNLTSNDIPKYHLRNFLLLGWSCITVHYFF